MPFDANRFKAVTRRSFLILTIKYSVLSLLCVRLFYIQVIKFKDFRKKADNNRIKNIVIPAPRGIIFDKNMIPLAQNMTYRRIIAKKNITTDQTIADVLSIIKLHPSQRGNILHLFQSGRDNDFVIYNYLTTEQYINIAANLYKLPGIFLDTGIARIYAHDLAYSNIIGYVSIPSKDDIKTQKYVVHPDVKLGRNWIEKYYNNTLTGKNGYKSIEINAGGAKLREIAVQKPTIGNNLVLSIDSHIQEAMFYAGYGHKMSSVLLDCNTSAMLGAISLPSYNITSLSQQIESGEWDNLLKDPDRPMFNRVIQAAYPPGSTFKIVIALAALKMGFDPSTKYNCTGQTKIGRRVIRCWNENGHGNINLHEALQKSCNIYFYRIAEMINTAVIKETCNDLHIGKIFDTIPFIKEQNAGLIPDPMWKTKYYHDVWRGGDTVNLVIGQGFAKVNCLQMANMISQIATFGKAPLPWMVDRPHTNTNIDGYNYEFVRNALWSASNEKGGTSFGSRITERGIEFAGKTGTSQVVSRYVPKGYAYRDFERPHGMFVGFAPFTNPRFAISVIYENGGYGATNAAPFAKKILYYAQKLYNGDLVAAKTIKEQIINGSLWKA